MYLTRQHPDRRRVDVRRLQYARASPDQRRQLTGQASKITSFFVGVSLATMLYFGRGLATKLLVLIAIGLLIGFWFIGARSFPVLLTTHRP